MYWQYYESELDGSLIRKWANCSPRLRTIAAASPGFVTRLPRTVAIASERSKTSRNPWLWRFWSAPRPNGQHAVAVKPAPASSGLDRPALYDSERSAHSASQRLPIKITSSRSGQPLLLCQQLPLSPLDRGRLEGNWRIILETGALGRLVLYHDIIQDHAPPARGLGRTRFP